MEAIFTLVIISMFLPFLVSLAGSGGVWKFLSLFCGLASIGVGMATSGSGIMFGPWIVAWVFAGIALASASSERRQQRLESLVASQNSGQAPFTPDGTYAGIPYRVMPDGSIDAIMQGAVVRFKSMDALLAAASSK